jgi:putative ABC transport system ATP-binding protein
MSSEELLQMHEICHVYGKAGQKVQALSGISLTISKGEFVAVRGPSGSGKSTLLHIIGCLLRPTSGSYKLIGRETSQLHRNELAGVRNTTFGFVFQNFNLLPRASALHNVTLPLVYAGWARQERIVRAEELLSRVGLGSRMSHRPNQLSGGEQQRVGIARALANRPRILLADEPTGNVDTATGYDIMNLFESLLEEDLTVVIVSHDRDVVSRASRIVSLVDSKLA